MRYDFIVIGAGAVGCAIARELSPLGSTAVIERHPKPGTVTSRLNSGVVHSGIHLKPDFLKAKFAREGGPEVIAFCQAHDVPNKNVGMHIVIGRQDLLRGVAEIHPFLRLVRRAKKQDITMAVRRAQTVREVEPAVRCLCGIHIPGVHIIDPVRYVQAMAQESEALGANFYFSQTVSGISATREGAEVSTPQNSYHARVVINAGGLYADQIAGLAGYGYKQYFYRGEYYEVNPTAGVITNGLVYPVPPKGAKGLGIHATPTTDGRLLLGPNVTRVDGPEMYETNRTPVSVFHRSVTRFLPNLKPEDLTWSFSGIRAKLSDEPIENDFFISYDRETVPMINLIGIESPGLTSSIAIARYVRRLIHPD